MRNTINFGSFVISKSFAEGTTLGDVLANASVKDVLELTGEEIFAQALGEVLTDGETVTVTLAAPAPAPAPVVEVVAPTAPTGTIRVKIQYGTGNTTTRDLPRGATVGQVLTDPTVRGALGYGTSVEGHIDSRPMPTGTTLADCDHVQVYDVACTKAAAPKGSFGGKPATKKAAPAKPAAKKAAPKKC